MQNQNLQSKFDNFEWENSSEKFEAWKRGETGFPIIDAVCENYGKQDICIIELEWLYHHFL